MIYQKDYFGFVYKWTNIKTKKFYIGSHHGSIEDGYLGSGVYFRYAYDKNPKNFKRQILEFNHIDNAKLTLKIEQKFLDTTIGVGNKNFSYNISKIAGGGWSLFGKTQEEISAIYLKIGQTLKNKTNKQKQESLDKRKKTLEENPQILEGAIKKSSKTKNTFSKEKKEQIANTLRKTLKENPQLVVKRVEKWKKAYDNKSEIEKKNIVKNRRKLSNLENQQRIEKQKNTIKDRTTKENKEIVQKYKETMSKKSEKELKEIRLRAVRSFKNRTDEEKRKSEEKRLASRNLRRDEISRNIKEGIRKKKLMKDKI